MTLLCKVNNLIKTSQIEQLICFFYSKDLKKNLSICYFRNVIKFNEIIFVKCLITNYFIHPLRIIVFKLSEC